MIENAIFEKMFDVIPFGVYVADIEKYTIVYMNATLTKSRGNYVGLKCYEALYRLEKPCPFCLLGQLVDEKGKPNGETIVHELYNEADERWYQLQDRAMTWPDGRTVKYSIAVDVTALKAAQSELAEAHAELALANKERSRL